MLHAAPAEADTLRLIAVNMADQLADVPLDSESAQVHHDRLRAFLGDVALRDPDAFFVSEAFPEAGTITPAVAELFPAHAMVVFDNDDCDDRRDRHRNVLLVKPERLVEAPSIERLGGRNGIRTWLRVGASAIEGYFAHLLDRPQSEREVQAAVLSEELYDAPSAFVMGDLNVVGGHSWLTWLLRRPRVKWIVNKLPATDPGEMVPGIHAPGIVGRVLTRGSQALHRLGSLAQRTVAMAEDSWRSPLRVLGRAGFEDVDYTHQATKWIRGPFGIKLIGLPLDHALVKRADIEDFAVLPTNGLSDHDAIMLDVRPRYELGGTLQWLSRRAGTRRTRSGRAL